MTVRCSTHRQCRWCGTPISRGNKTGLCREHYVEYTQLYNDLMHNSYHRDHWKNRSCKIKKYDKCSCGNLMTIGAEQCWKCRGQSEYKDKYYDTCECGRQKTGRAVKCWSCHMTSLKSKK